MTEHPISVGLGGDGDEIMAIADVEAEFGVALDYDDAPTWRTAGDVFRSLLKALPPEAIERAGIWDRFANALSQQTGIEAGWITAESPLLCATHPWRWLSAASYFLWILAGGCVLALMFSAIVYALARGT